MKRTAVVLGAAGFLGGSLCEVLCSHKFQLHLASRSGGHFNNIPIHKIDITKKDSLVRWPEVQKVDVIFYLSSIMPHEFIDHEFKAIDQNLRMHQEVCRLWLKHRCHLVYASSAAVYGGAPVPWTEKGPVAPDSFYAISKLLGEHIFDVTGTKEHLTHSAMRIKAPYGYKDRNKTVVNIFIEKALSGENLELYGRGLREQDFIYIKDVAQVFWSAFMKQSNGIYNIASGKTVTMKQLAQAVIRATGSRSKIVLNGKPDPQEKNKVKIDVQKSRRELGFQPRYSLVEGLKDMLRVYQRGA